MSVSSQKKRWRKRWINGLKKHANWIKTENVIKWPIMEKNLHRKHQGFQTRPIFGVVIVNGILERIVLPVIADDVPDKKRTVARKIIRI